MCRHNLDGLGQPTVPEGRTQVGMPGKQGLRTAMQQVNVQASIDVRDELHAVQIDTLVGELRQREKSLLQGAQRQHVLDLRLLFGTRHDCACQDAVSSANASALRPEALIGALCTDGVTRCESPSVTT
ncbi:Uncharacterised protein [Mycobacteroides abscessus subsp. abscessus]|nr:Uncharacterised protein [Mycobacteroides abscessus subsp. abscessus]